MQLAPTYDDVVRDVKTFLTERRDAAIECGVERWKILFDPGIGFGKTIDQNLQLLAGQSQLLELEGVLLIGTSRKGFIGQITHEPDPKRRTYGTAATVAHAVANGAGIVRVHDVRPMKQVVDMAYALLRAGRN
jgi:dihydropteroate synthase